MHFAMTHSDASTQVNAPTRHRELATTKRSWNLIKVTTVTRELFYELHANAPISLILGTIFFCEDAISKSNFNLDCSSGANSIVKYDV